MENSGGIHCLKYGLTTNNLLGVEFAFDQNSGRYRIDGLLYEVMHPPQKLKEAITSRLKIMAKLDISETWFALGIAERRRERWRALFRPPPGRRRSPPRGARRLGRADRPRPGRR